MEVSVIIVNYKTCDLTLQCIESIYKHTISVQYEVIVVDNDSKDDSCKRIREKFPQVLLIESDINLGFGRGNNLGVRSSKGKYLFLLNSDCILIENTIKAFFDYMEMNNRNSTIGAIGAILFDGSMKPTDSYHNFASIKTELKSTISVLLFKPSKKICPRIRYNTTQYSKEVECVLGADMFISRDIFNSLSGFDEQFFLYFEETDLQKRMANIALKRIILNNERIIHLGEGSTKTKSPSLKKWTLFNDSRFRYCKKHWTSFHYRIFYILMFPILFCPLLLRKYSRNDKKEYWNVLCRK